ncbi:MAG: glycosyltransferase family 2 protein [Bacteroidales bacterium]
MKTLTVFTPAFNRAHTIGRTYESLCRQTSFDFVWLIVDDGSSDNTEELVRGWIETENRFEIIYYKQINQGMHGAHNTAYRLIETELNVCIDSDDCMTDDAVEKIVSFWKENGSKKVAGMIALDATLEGNLIGNRFPDGLTHTTLSGYYARGGNGDKKLIYRTEVMRQYPEYPIFDGEKYVGLSYKYLLCDQDYELLVLNEVLCLVEYQLDGSSASMYQQYFKYPRGFAFLRTVNMQYEATFKRRFMEAIHYVSSSIILRNGKFLKESPRKLLTIAAIPMGVALYLFLNYKKNSSYKIQR